MTGINLSPNDLADWFEEQVRKGAQCKWVDLRELDTIDQKKLQRNLRREFRKRGFNYRVHRHKVLRSLQIKIKV